jgi:thiol-disulfide isomerase/thioredoxin
MTSRIFGSLLTVTAGAIMATLIGCGGEPAKSPSSNGGGEGGEGHAEVGKPAPELSVQTLNDKGKIDLSGMQGKVVVVDFWATWCGPCKQSFPKLEALSKKVSDKVVIVGVSVDDEKKGIVEFAKENGASFAIGWDEGHAIANRWKVGTMPTTFIVDATGKVRHIHDGYHDGETDVMEKELNALVAEAGSGGGSGDAKAKSDDSSSKSSDSSTASKDSGSKDSATKDDAGKTDESSSTEDPPPKKPAKKPKGKGKKKKKT